MEKHDNSAASDVDSVVVIKIGMPKKVHFDCPTDAGTVEGNTTSTVVGPVVIGKSAPVLLPVTPVVGWVPE